ncbi:hypothetical protein MPTK1_3g19610 [Marchantia polymorpha subsp. ruderalis]|uniref:Galactose oxidase-like Early set domain-containing protein n=2 Tax=Marchantia polymorpha TaxID=3197 RepID=A0AAF6B2L8_MARPO|nr:hypothetical protein MARPO_0049s0073 [Marchantia polymorpha]BBN06252.1 hypothetical protein Mp_3g19610 [Marchantia polymorpha subsp. ruderalis]|eukprot:PTQ38791.1 hypothetical protein MARPO_0049s0073 [Marchantia polymorpha]
MASWTELEQARGVRRWRAAAGLLALLLCASVTQVAAQGGSWELLVENAGIASMHTMVTHFGTVILLDRTNIGASQIDLPAGVCRDNEQDQILTHDCTAHSVEFTPGSNAIRPLFIFTDTWCSSGQFGPDGTMTQTGGDSDGLMKIRKFVPCGDGSCDWTETTTELQNGRWYASNQVLPDGSQIVVGGRSVFTLEFVPSKGEARYLPLLEATKDAQDDNYYPFVHLLPSGNLFIFANKDSIIYDYNTDAVVRTMPTLAGTPRNYPSAGSSVLLPLTAADGYTKAEVLVCGGAQFGAYLSDHSLPASNDCGRIDASDPASDWAIEVMPYARTMGDMVMLPNQHTLIINGAQTGSQGWGLADNPTFNPLEYNPFAAAGARFAVMNPTTIARMYHSTANLLPDGRVLVAGSNTHQYYDFTGPYPTELRLEAFSPQYLSAANAPNKPAITAAPGSLAYGELFTVSVTIANPPAGNVQLLLLSSPFTTHSYSQGQRQLNLDVAAPVAAGGGSYTISATAPPGAAVAPPQYYMLFALNGAVPSSATWVRIG